MSTPEQPLTRKQLRELERTGAVPVVGEQTPDGAAETPPAPPAPRPAAPAAPAPLPIPDANVDLGAAPLTRRQARQQERIRTASVPVITPDVAASHAPASAPALIETVPGAQTDAPDLEVSEPTVEDLVEVDADVVVEEQPVEADADDAPAVEAEVVEEVTVEDAEPAADVVVDEAAIESEADETGAAEDAVVVEVEDDAVAPEAAADEAPKAEGDEESRAVDDVSDEPDAEAAVDDAEAEAEAEDEEPEEPATVGPQFGASLLAGEPEVEAVEAPPSFDELIARSATSATTATPSALILSQAPAAPSLAGPITATGEVIITGSYRLPDGLGSSGVDPRAADGKDVDAVLLDGELPASSSPTPIAASAAISTVRGSDDIIRPPAPEKGNKLILSLAITAGVLAVAVIAVLVVALTNGVFS